MFIGAPGSWYWQGKSKTSQIIPKNPSVIHSQQNLEFTDLFSPFKFCLCFFFVYTFLFQGFIVYIAAILDLMF